METSFKERNPLKFGGTTFMTKRGKEQYMMQDARKEEKDFHYRVGYTSTTGNQTGNKKEPGKRSDLES